MTMESRRLHKLEKELQRTVAKIIASLKDPRVQFVSVVDVKLSKDMRYLDVYVSVLDSSKKEELKAVLKKAQGFIRRQIPNYMRLRIVPQVRVKLDESIERGSRVLQIIKKLRRERGEDDDLSHDVGDGAEIPELVGELVKEDSKSDSEQVD